MRRYRITSDAGTSRVTILILEVDEEQGGEHTYRVHSSAFRTLSGKVRVVREDHPDRTAQLIRRILDSAFPFQPGFQPPPTTEDR